jgi:hypothetical protein
MLTSVHIRRQQRSRGNEMTTVLVVGTAQPSAAATARSLSRAGYRVIGAWQGGRLAGRTRYCEKLYRIPSTSDARAFLAAVNGICRVERVDAVMPLAEEMLGVLATGRDPAAAWTLVGPSPSVFRALCNKAGLLETLAAARLPSPLSAVVTSDGPNGPLPPLPSYVKVVSGVEGGSASGRPYRVTDPSSRDGIVSAHVASGRVVLVQEEVNGPLWRFHFARCGGRIAHVGVMTLAEYPFRVGESTVSRFTATPPALAEVGGALLEAVDFEGVGSLGFVERDGVFYAHDINLRMLGSIAGTIAAGLDMPRLGVEIALGRDPTLTSLRVRNLHFVHLHGELAALRGTLAGEPTGRSAAEIATGIVLAALHPGRMLYPLDLTDPLPILAVLAKAARGRAQYHV